MTLEKLKRFSLVVALVFGVIALPVAPASAFNVFDGKACTGQNKDTTLCDEATDKTKGIDPLVQTIVGLLLFAIGIVSVIMIIIGGIRYTTSNGDGSKVKQAKDTILYSVVGLVVALLAFAIVSFVVNQF